MDDAGGVAGDLLHGRSCWVGGEIGELKLAIWPILLRCRESAGGYYGGGAGEVCDEGGVVVKEDSR